MSMSNAGRQVGRRWVLYSKSGTVVLQWLRLDRCRSGKARCRHFGTDRTWSTGRGTQQPHSGRCQRDNRDPSLHQWLAESLYSKSQVVVDWDDVTGQLNICTTHEHTALAHETAVPRYSIKDDAADIDHQG